MLLTIRTTHVPATDLGFLLGKHPDRFQTKSLAFGKAHVFYPEANEKACTAAMLLEINNIKLQKNKRQQFSASFKLADYVNDRAYAASSFLSNALAKVLGSALNGNCKERPDLVNQSIPLEVKLTAVPARGGLELIHRLFEPLGYEIEAQTTVLDSAFPAWGDSPYYNLCLRKTATLQSVLTHLYVLIPALDNKKHYYVSQAEIEKLLAKGEAWLKDHPEKNLITKRYLRYRNNYVRRALNQLLEEEEHSPKASASEDQLEQPLKLHDLRHETVTTTLKELGVQSVIDLGCGSGKLLRHLIKEGQFTKIHGMDVSHQAIEVALDRLYLRDASPLKKERIKLFHGSLTYCDQRTKGFDAAVLVEVIEHLDESRLDTLQQIVFGYAEPDHVIITTPNREYNVLFEGLPFGKFRHSDHRFEWTRTEMENWATAVAKQYDYQVQFEPIGPIDEQYGAPSQMAVFKKKK